jgi:sugar lactone lactonase YvrE
MAESFRCPSCSAPLEFEGKPMQKCRFCGSNVIVPAGVVRNSSVFGGVGEFDFGDLSSLKGKALKIGEVQRLLQNGNKINAIKIFRETFGVGLKEAKDAVDAMERGESIDLSRMQLHDANARATIQADAADPWTAKKTGVPAGNMSLGAFAVVAFVIFGIIFGVLYFISTPVEDPAANVVNVPTPPTPEPQKSVEEEILTAQEILKFGGEGVGAGKFKDNRAVAVDAEDRIYTADYSGGRIQVFDGNGVFQTQLMADTAKTIDALATDRKGSLFVLQGYDIHRFAGGRTEPAGTYRVDFAADMAVGLDGKIYIAGRRGEITVLGADGAKLKTIRISKDLNLDYLQKIAVDGTGNFYLLDNRSAAVYKLSPDGKLLTRFGGRGSGPADKMPKAMFSGTPDDLAVDSQGRLYVSQNTRISVFDANGNFLNDFKTTQAFGMALNDADDLFVASRPYVVKYKLNF